MRPLHTNRLFTALLAALLLAATSGAVIGSAVAPSAAQAGDIGFGGGTGRPGAPAPVDMTLVQSTPERGHWGVTGLDPNRTVDFETPVWDFAVIGNRIYVGGAFLNVQRNGTSAPISRPYLAAFDLRSGAWDPNFQPQLNGSVYALEVSPRGTLLVGGEFTSVEGRTKTAGFTSLDPVTGAYDAQWAGSVERAYSTDRAVVRALEVIGDAVYVGGNFSHALGSTQRTRVYKVARMNATFGYPDSTFKPNVAGAGVWGMGIDTDRNLMHLTGFFTSVGGAPGTADFASVDLVTGALATGLVPLQRNNSTQLDMYDVEVAGDRIWAGGSEHMVHVLDASTRSLIGWHTTGYRSPDNFTWNLPGRVIFAGGDYQVLEEVGEYVIAGCHCNEEEDFGILSHYSSFDNARFRTLMVEAYNTSTGRLVSSFVPDLAQSVEGAWAVHSDGLGCLLVGGDFELGGVKTGSPFWLGNWARFCPPGVDVGPDTASPSIPADVTVTTPGAGGTDSVTVAWTASADNRGIAGYDVYRDGVVIGNTTGTTLTDDNLPAGNFGYRVQAIDTSGNRSAGSPSINATVVGPDALPPTVPAGLTATVTGANVTLNWTASTDPSGIESYTVYRDDVNIGVATMTTFADANLANGTYNYSVEARDRAGNTSARTVAVAAIVGAIDTQPPTIPAGIAATVSGSSVTLTWTASADNVGVTGYAVYRNGAYLGWATGPTFTQALVPNGVQNYTLRAYDAAGNRSAPSAPLAVTVGAPDTEAPSVPIGLSGTVNATTVTLTWAASTDNVGVSGYAVYRNGAYVGWATTATFTQTGVPIGTQNYTLRAYDVAGNRSDRSAPLALVVA